MWKWCESDVKVTLLQLRIKNMHKLHILFILEQKKGILILVTISKDFSVFIVLLLV